jgi:LAGLIDADG-like domain
VEANMRIVYEFEPARYQDSVTGVRRISYYNVALAVYMGMKVLDLLREARHMTSSLKKELIRAFFDDEGCIDYRPDENRRSVRGYQKDVRILKLIKSLLNDFGIDARVVKPNEVVIVGKENLIKFKREVNFSRGVYINGNRSNSRWKKHIEKRKLLKQAIKSFKN